MAVYIVKLNSEWNSVWTAALYNVTPAIPGATSTWGGAGVPQLGATSSRTMSDGTRTGLVYTTKAAGAAASTTEYGSISWPANGDPPPGDAISTAAVWAPTGTANVANVTLTTQSVTANSGMSQASSYNIGWQQITGAPGAFILTSPWLEQP